MTNEELCREMCGDTLSSDPPKRFAYNIAVAIFAYIAPLIAIFYSYFRILYVLQRRCDRKTFRFVKCQDGSTCTSDANKLNNSIKSNSKKNYTNDRARTSTAAEESLVREEINTHNTKTITRAKLKTLKLTAIIGKKNKRTSFKNQIFLFLVICFILCWTPYYCIVFFLLITDARIARENSTTNLTVTTPMDPSLYDQPSRDERSLLIVMMLAVSNSVLDPLIYGNFQNM